jgi:starch synthase
VKIVSVASEAIPFAKTGGLGDIAGTLPLEIRGLGHESIVFLPRYKTVEVGDWKPAISELQVPLGGEKITGRVYQFNHPRGVPFYFIDYPDFFCRQEFYGTSLGDYPDNDRRFIFFQRAVLETLRALKIRPDIIHCHDWETGLIPVYLKTLYAKEPLFEKTKSVFTVHNLAYQGNFPPDSLPVTGLGWDQFKMEKLEFYGKVSFLKGALVYADVLTTVSESYSLQIQSKEFGCGLEGILAKRALKLFGIVNGIDYDEWNPETDKDIFERYGLASVQKKRNNKTQLQKEDGLKVDAEIPLCGVVSRLVDHKGIDILIPALQGIRELGMQFVLLGTGEEKYHQVLREIAKKNKGHFGMHIVFDPKMAKHIYAGCDMFIMPSYYEPCGLAQMISLRYGTIPVVRATGGLADTIQEFDPRTGEGNGFRFNDYSSDALLEALKKGLKVYQDKRSWQRLIQNAMTSDFSWTASAKRYIKLYEEIRQGEAGKAGKINPK